jgi:hypothetical protein
MNTSHPAEDMLVGMKWAGKTVRSMEDVDPIEIYDDEEKRAYNADWEHARVSP